MTGPGSLPTIEYSPGGWVGVAGSQAWLLADIHLGAPVIGRCWELVREGAAVGDVLATLFSAGSRSVASFAVVRYADATAQVAVRGVARVELVPVAGEPVDVRTPGVGYLVEHKVDHELAEIRLVGPAGSGEAEAVTLPLAGGVVLAAHLGVRPAGSAAAPDRSGFRAEPSASPQPATPAPAPAPAPAAPMPTPVVQPIPVVEERRAPADAGPDFGHLFGATQLPVTDPDEEFFTERPEPRGAAPAGSDRVPDQVERKVAATTLPPIGTEPPDRAAGPDDELITDVPWAKMPGTSEEPSGRATVAADAAYRNTPAGELDDDLTVTTIRRNPPRRTPSSAGTGPTVTAVRCEAGHLNPTEAKTCRVCDGVVPVQTPTVVPRPTLGVLRLSDGDVIQLDRGVVLGRAKDAPQGPDGPNFVHLRSPDKEISRRHVEVRLDGWQVVVVDLDSHNGTVVTLPNRAPEQLPTGGSKVLEPGSIVSLAGAVSFRFEVTG